MEAQLQSEPLLTVTLLVSKIHPEHKVRANFFLQIKKSPLLLKKLHQAEALSLEKLIFKWVEFFFKNLNNGGNPNKVASWLKLTIDRSGQQWALNSSGNNKTGKPKLKKALT